jgi:hypothetical protein
MSTINLARARTLGPGLVRQTTSRAGLLARVWSVCSTWLEIVASAMALTHALETAPPRQRAQLAAGWLELLDRRLR